MQYWHTAINIEIMKKRSVVIKSKIEYNKKIDRRKVQLAILLNKDLFLK